MLRIFRSITSRFDVLGWSLMYLRWLARLVSDYRSFPLASLSLRVPSSLRPQVSTPIQCRRASPRSPCQRRSLFVFPFCPYFDSLIPFFFDRLRFPVHAWSHPYRIDHISYSSTSLTIPGLPRYSPRDPSPEPSYLATPWNYEFTNC